MRRVLPMIAVLALALPASARAITFTQHPVAATSAGWGTPIIGPREWYAGPPAPLEKALTESAAMIAHNEPIHGGAALGISDPYLEGAHPWGEVDGSWCEGEQVFVKGVPHAIPNPSGKPEGSFGMSWCTTVAIGPEGALWFGDRGDDSIGKVEANGTVVEYPMPTIPAALYGYPGDAVVNPPGAIATVNGELWVAESNAKAELTVNPTATSARAKAARHHHKHRRHRP